MNLENKVEYIGSKDVIAKISPRGERSPMEIPGFLIIAYAALIATAAAGLALIPTYLASERPHSDNNCQVAATNPSYP